MPDIEVNLRGAGARILQTLGTYKGPKKVIEILSDGPRGTSKTVSIGWLIRAFFDLYPGIRILYVRKTRASITQAFCPDFERICLEHDPETRAGPSPENRQEYRHRTKAGPISVAVLAGLDNPGKIYSTNWDVVIADEAAQFTEIELVDFYGVLRQWTKGMQFQALICLTNPRGPKHFLLERWKRGISMRFVSRHTHNPKWYDAATGTWTPEGKAFIDGLKLLPGTLRARNYEGKWQSSEGAVWDCWDDAKNITAVRDGDVIYRAAAMDWGYTDPCSLLIGEKYASGHVRIVREIYRKRMGIDWWGTEVLAARRDLDIKAMVVDPSRPEIIDHFNRMMREAYPRDDVPFARGADNARSTTGADFGGLDLVRWYIEREKLTAWSDRLRHYPDPELVAAGLPLSLVDEIPEYVYWRPKGEEDDANAARDKTDPRCADHACDSLRYLIKFMHDHDLGDPGRKPKEPEHGPEHSAMMKALGL